MKIFVVAIFLITYMFLMLKKGHPFIVLGTAIGLLFLSRAINLAQAFASINYNVLGVFLGTMILSSLFIFSGVPAYLATKLVDRSKTVGMALLSVCLLAGFISSFAENVATVFIVAPIAFEVAKRLKANPVPFLIGIAVSSNLQGCATMIGDSPSIILALSSGMNFMDFFWMKGRPGITFAVELGAVASFVILYLLFRKYKELVVQIEEVKVKTWFPAWLLGFMIFTLAVSSFIKNKPAYSIAFICLAYGIIGLIWHELKHRESLSAIKDLDWHTFFFLIGVFVLVGSLTYAGIIDDIANFIIGFTKGNKLLAYTIIVWLSVLLSAFVDNIPYTVAMIPVAKLVAASLGISPQLLLFGLLIGTSLGGNITPIGASANMVAVGLLRKKGLQVSFGDFVKIGLPFTLAAVSVAYLFIWFIWSR
ncbi:MAG: SLC13 family permease [Candidatus Omnitrophica bacterium]|nr:SLC13 family permease [Candidatus Omnitrophota bacterium]MDD5592190.1 SLC13 family permease [Candidatus Omnitrophota bacterium]